MGETDREERRQLVETAREEKCGGGTRKNEPRSSTSNPGHSQTEENNNKVIKLHGVT